MMTRSLSIIRVTSAMGSAAHLRKSTKVILVKAQLMRSTVIHVIYVYVLVLYTI